MEDTDDSRADLELSVIELLSLGTSTRSIRRYVNDAIKAYDEGKGATPWLEKLWKREA